MTDNQTDEEKKAIDQALKWFVRLQSGHAGQGEHREFAGWLSHSPLNRKEYAKLDTIWADLDQISFEKSLPLAHQQIQGLNQAGFPSKISRRQLLTGGAIAASVATIGLVNDWPTALLSDHYTGTGEVKKVILADGSKVTLDAGTSLTVDFSTEQRKTRLKEGRAFFEVAQSVQRPFVVKAGRGVIRVLDARFTVHQWADVITVSAIENTAEVTAPNGDRVVLSQGQAVSYRPLGLSDAGLDTVAPADMGGALEWQHNKLVFEDRPLQQVIADLNRYRPGQIFIANRELLDLRVSGSFDMSKPQDILATIAKILPVRTISASKYFVVLV